MSKVSLVKSIVVGAALMSGYDAIADARSGSSLSDDKASNGAMAQTFSFSVGTDANTAQKDINVVSIIGRGVGVDTENALKDAYRDAIERAVGMYVDAEQLMKNGELVQDQILTHSNAYIEKFDIKEEKKDSNGLVKICILAQVKKRALAHKMTEVLPPQVFKVGRELQDAHAKLTTQAKQNIDGVALLKKGLSGLNPRELVKVSLVSPNPYVRTDEKKPDTAFLHYLLKFEIDQDKYQVFAATLDRVLGQVSLAEARTVRGVIKRIGNRRLAEILDLNRLKSVQSWRWNRLESYFSGGCYLDPYEFPMEGLDEYAVMMCDERVSADSLAAGSKFKRVLLIDSWPKYTLAKMKEYPITEEMALALHEWAWNFDPREGSRPFYYSMVFTASNGEELCVSQFSVSEDFLINLSSNQNSKTFNVFPLIGGNADTYYKWVRCEIPVSALPEIKSFTIERVN